MSGNTSWDWLEHLLARLFDDYERDAALRLLRSEAERHNAQRALAPALVAHGMPAGMLETEEGQSLFLAVLGLRLKFARDEARERVRLNIAMRAGRR